MTSSNQVQSTPELTRWETAGVLTPWVVAGIAGRTFTSLTFFSSLGLTVAVVMTAYSMSKVLNRIQANSTFHTASAPLLVAGVISVLNSKLVFAELVLQTNILAIAFLLTVLAAEILAKRYQQVPAGPAAVIPASPFGGTGYTLG
ncbi:MAG: hypothetical protein H0X51_02665 [Parachlamydiaceae bacterium]|nr:hypothetical protein [Parachlamydiaceae bacterium]